MERGYLRSVQQNDIISTNRPNCANIARTVDTSTTTASEPPISSLPNVLVVMTYKRVNNLRLLLHSISDMMNAAPRRHTPLKLIVTQSVDEEIPNFTQPVAELLQTLRTGHEAAFQSIDHIEVPIQKRKDGTSGSFTNNLKMYGNKRNSMKNLLGGLRRSIEMITKAPSNVMVMEDDVLLSCDLLEYFSYASKLMNLDRENRPRSKRTDIYRNGGSKRPQGPLDVASTELLMRPSFFIGNHDTNNLLNRENPSATIRMRATSRTVVKTYAWMLSRSYVHEYAKSLNSIIHSSNGIDDDAGTLSGCYYCEAYCYDHVAEWTLSAHGRRVIYPAVPRVTQTKGSGMTYAENPVTEIYQRFVPEENFDSSGLAPVGRSIVQFFDLPGASAWSNRGPSIGYYVTLCALVMFFVLVCVAKKKINRIKRRD